MTTPKDTWISVKDAMPRIGAKCRVMTHEMYADREFDAVCKHYIVWHHVKYKNETTKRFFRIDNGNLIDGVVFWKLLSKPKTK